MARTRLSQTVQAREMKQRDPSIRPFVSFGAIVIKERPKHVTLMGACIMQWTVAETYFAVLLATLLNASTDAAVAVYQTLRRSTARRDSIKEAAKNVLVEEDFLLVKSLLEQARIVETQRNNLAHGFWGVCADIEDGLAWIAQEEMTFIHVDYNKQNLSSTPVVIDATPRFDRMYNNTFIYSQKDLQEIIELVIITSNFISIISAMHRRNGNALNDQERSLLKSFAPIPERLKVILDRIATAQQNQQQPS